MVAVMVEGASVVFFACWARAPSLVERPPSCFVIYLLWGYLVFRRDVFMHIRTVYASEWCNEGAYMWQQSDRKNASVGTGRVGSCVASGLISLSQERHPYTRGLSYAKGGTTDIDAIEWSAYYSSCRPSEGVYPHRDEGRERGGVRRPLRGSGSWVTFISIHTKARAGGSNRQITVL